MRAAAEFPPRSEAETHCPDRRSFKLPYRRGGGGGGMTTRSHDEAQRSGHLPDSKVGD